MILIELFLKTVEAKIREEHAEYVKDIKRLPVPQENGKGFKAFIKGLFSRKISVEDKLLKGYSKGIEKALNVLEREYKRFIKRLNRGEFDGGNYERD